MLKTIVKKIEILSKIPLPEIIQIYELESETHFSFSICKIKKWVRVGILRMSGYFLEAIFKNVLMLGYQTYYFCIFLIFNLLNIFIKNQRNKFIFEIFVGAKDFRHTASSFQSKLW